MVGSRVEEEVNLSHSMPWLAQRWCGISQPVNMLNTSDLHLLLPINESTPQALYLIFELRNLGYKFSTGWVIKPLAEGGMTIYDVYLSAASDAGRTESKLASLQRWRREHTAMWVSELLYADGRTLR